MKNGKLIVVAFAILIVGMILINVAGFSDPVGCYWIGVIFSVLIYAVNRWVLPKFEKEED